MYPDQHSKMHFILTGEPQIHRQLKFPVEQPGFSGKRQRPSVFQNNAENVSRRRKAEAAHEERNISVRIHRLIRKVQRGQAANKGGVLLKSEW